MVERELLARAVQRVAAGNADDLGLDRHELALRALDTLQLNQPTAVPGDPVRQIGLERRRIGGALMLTGASGVGMQFLTVRSSGGAIRQQQLRVGDGKGPTLHLSLFDADAGFNRFDDLSPEERSWAGAMRGMRRLDFGGEKLALAGGHGDLGLIQLADGSAHARRTVLGFSAGGLSIRALSQRIDDSFKRLSDLTDSDRKLFGAERGISHDSLDLGYAFSGGRKFTASTLSLRAANGSAQRQQFEYSGGPKLQLRLTFGRVDPKFDRIKDLLAADQSVLAPQQGMRWSDLSANLKPTRWLTTENRWYEGTSLVTGQRSMQQNSLWTIQLSPRTKLVLLRNLLESPSGHGSQKNLTQSVRLEQWLTHSLYFTGFREMVHQSVPNTPDSTAKRLALHMNSGPGLPFQGSADFNTAQALDGKNERTLQWSFGLPMHKGLTFQAKGDQRSVAGSPAARTLALGLNGAITHDWNLAFTLNDANPGKGPDTRDLGLRLTFAGLRDTPVFKETRVVIGMGDTQGIPSVIPVSKKAPPAPKTPPARRVQSVSLETKFRGQPVMLGFNAAAGTAGGLAYRLASDPKRRLMIEAVREVRDLGRTSLIARERYAFRARVSRTSQLTISREAHPEQSPGKLLVGHTLTKTEAQAKLKGLDITASLAWDDDHLGGQESTLTSFGLGGNIDSLNSLRVNYTSKTNGTDPAVPRQFLHLEFNRKPDELLLVALKAEWRDWGGKRADELAWQLDLKAMF
jgi:hypothetical protein